MKFIMLEETYGYGDTLIFEVKDIEPIGQDRFSYNSPDEEGVITSSFVRVTLGKLVGALASFGTESEDILSKKYEELSLRDQYLIDNPPSKKLKEKYQRMMSSDGRLAEYTTIEGPECWINIIEFESIDELILLINLDIDKYVHSYGRSTIKGGYIFANGQEI